PLHARSVNDRMNQTSATASTSLSPLEEFVRLYLEASGGAWDEVQPQVYHVLLPSGPTGSPLGAPEEGVLRTVLDPDAFLTQPRASRSSAPWPRWPTSAGASWPNGWTDRWRA